MVFYLPMHRVQQMRQNRRRERTILEAPPRCERGEYHVEDRHSSTSLPTLISGVVVMIQRALDSEK